MDSLGIVFFFIYRDIDDLQSYKWSATNDALALLNQAMLSFDAKDYQILFLER